MSTNTSDQAKPQIVLVHGLWMTPRSWEHWAERFRGRGHEVLAPSWPGMEAEVEELNRDPSPMKGVGIKQIVDHYEHIIRGLDSPPIIMGHSIGGTVLQLLLDRGLGRAGVGIAPGTVKGVPDLPLSTMRVGLSRPRQPVQPQQGDGAVREAVPLRLLQHDVTGGVGQGLRALPHPGGEPRAVRRRPRHLHAQRPDEGRLHARRPAPMLSIAFENDHIVPPKPARHNVEKYKSKALTVFKEFPGRPHFPGAPGWEEVADYALAWATNPTATQPSRQRTKYLWPRD